MPLASGMDRSYIDTEIDLYNQTAREEAVQDGALFVDITGISREAETDLELLAPDRLRSSGVMYGRWVDRIFPVAAEILE